MDNVVIRRAEKRDCSRLLELVRELAHYERAPDEVTITPEHFEESGFGNKPVWWAFVAEVNGTVEGFALYYIRFSTWKGQRMYLEDLVVTEKMRGKGLGKRLFDQLFAEASAKGLGGISWQVLEWNEPAINFYKKLSAAFDGEWINCSVNVGSAAYSDAEHLDGHHPLN
ncbi:GNAT family N-acetyltransferase [Segetibacter sp. 3557_3]|uniref:GNAT family N-acetyltransferase n=1 Tax=Segetibacter sp. 3557_3 TaxID=2547429 RepID=UPI0010588DE9|nr:GNAT family N-acetyltransferase [Segetibacter sp. 3557_3]TDH21236.1 GNAT family N-acetyltransferase [Segetibacter sp. 3557_3]